MTIDIKAIKAAAEAATPGPWKSRAGFHTDTVEIFRPDRSIKKPFYPSELATVHVDLKNGKANAKHVATANPAAVIALCNEVERLRLPDDWYPDSKDWRESPGERGEWLRTMYEQAKAELEQLRAELDKQMRGSQ